MLGNRPRQGVAVVSTPILTRYYFEVIDDYLLEVRWSSTPTLAYFVRSTWNIYSPNSKELVGAAVSNESSSEFIQRMTPCEDLCNYVMLDDSFIEGQQLYFYVGVAEM
jgi:hypothetical protein